MKEVMRKCVSCSKIQNRDLMHRISFLKEDNYLYVNPNSKITGYSVYICKNTDCIKDVLQKKRLHKKFQNRNIKNFDCIEKELESFLK